MKIGVISYLPENDLKRRQARNQQHEWLKSIFPNHEIVIVAQKYKVTDYIDDNKIKYISFEQGIGPSRARNIILKEFYDSQEDFLLLLDDDCILYDYYDGIELLKELDEQPAKFKGIDNIVCNNPRYLPFKKENYKDKNVLKYWKFVKRP